MFCEIVSFIPDLYGCVPACPHYDNKNGLQVKKGLPVFPTIPGGQGEQDSFV